MPVVGRGFFRPAKNDDQGHGDAGQHHGETHNSWHGLRFRTIREAPPFCLLAMAITSGGCIVLFVYADWLFDLLAPVAGLKG